MPNPNQPGLVSGTHATRERHLYHATLPPKVVYTDAEEATLRTLGYSDDYCHQEYPKVVNGRCVCSAEEEAAASGGE